MDPIELPLEILEHIFFFVKSTQPTLHAATLVSRSWYSAAIKYLYHSPYITGKNFDLFIRSVCPSVNAHVRHNGLAELVRMLDMSRLVHEASKSLTARLLSRVKGQLEIFIAPQTSFAVISLAAISKSYQLRQLDLTLVSQSIELSDLLRALKKLESLEKLLLPKAWSAPYRGYETMFCKEWPGKLKEIHLNGVFNEINLTTLRNIPKTATHLWIEQRYELQSASFVSTFLEAAGGHLRFLRFLQRPTSDWSRPMLQAIHTHCRQLEHLSINVELFAARGMDVLQGLKPTPTYSRLDLDYSGIPGFGKRLGWSLRQLVDVLYDNALPSVRKVGIARSLGWTESPEMASQIADIDILLKAMARDDGLDARIPEEEAGVVIFG